MTLMGRLIGPHSAPPWRWRRAPALTERAVAAALYPRTGQVDVSTQRPPEVSFAPDRSEPRGFLPA